MENKAILSVNNVHVSVFDKLVLYDINLFVNTGTIHAIMGPNGSGKSSLAYALMGHPSYTITSGEVTFNGSNLLAMPVHERAKNGLFLSFQHPHEIPGVSVVSFLKEAYMAVTGKHISVIDFNTLLEPYCQQLAIELSFLQRGLNDGFSGGEKKRFELLQLLVLKPKVAILDEIDSGLDVDSLKLVAAGMRYARKENPALCLIIITHYQRVLDYITPDYVHVLCEGRITQSGDSDLARAVDVKGYNDFQVR